MNWACTGREKDHRNCKICVHRLTRKVRPVSVCTKRGVFVKKTGHTCKKETVIIGKLSGKSQ